MTDGHTGIENRQVNQGGSGSFQLTLSYLKQGTGEGEFVIHATSTTYNLAGGMPAADFLMGIGFAYYRGNCPFHRDRCFYRGIASLGRDAYGFENFDHTQQVHKAFQAFAGKVDELFQLQRQQDSILREVGIDSSVKIIFGPPQEIIIKDTDIPLWVDDVKFPSLRELDVQKAAIQKEIDALNRFLPLLYGTGEVLENAVIEALRFMGLRAQEAPKSFTADIFAETQDGSRKFGLEVTGVDGSIVKRSVKLTQVLEFERIKEHQEKTILIANTHNAKPIPKREGLEDFTQPVVDFLSHHPILLMTSLDLYRMVGDILASIRPKEELVEMLYNAFGRLRYPSP